MNVLHIANLAKLSLTDNEVNKFLPQLTKILEFVNQLSEVNTTNIEPTSQTTGLENVFRDDEVKIDQILPQNDYFKVPAILEKRTDK